MTYREKYENWLKSPVVGDELKWELDQIRDDDKAIQLRFAKDLEFGTAGLRGTLGAGSGCMNLVTVGWISAGLARVILSRGEADRGVVIGRDSRLMSKEFAFHAARVFAALGVKVYLYDDIRPTAAVSFAVLHFGAAAGVNITASHNPKQYNGYKVYGPDGAQLAPDLAEAVVREAGSDMLAPVSLCDFDEAVSLGCIQVIGEELDRLYLERIEASAVEKAEPCPDFHMVYTPFYGSGYRLVPQVLRDGKKNFSICAEQSQPNGNFPTADPPNPERLEAFALALEQAKKEKAQLVLGTDPDADRLGVLVLHDGEYRMLTGNQIGVLLCDYILSTRKAAGTLPKDGFVVKSIVSTNLAQAVCEEYGIELINVLTGFKYIGQQIDLLEDKGGRTFLFGFEESYGYLGASYARDKDAVYASMMVSDMALHYHRQGLDLIDVLERIYQKHGYYGERTIGLSLDPLTGMQALREKMRGLLENPPEQLAGLRVERAVDFSKGYEKLPPADIVALDLEGGTRVYIRPSGTEPKVKLYVMARAGSQEELNEQIQALSPAVQALVEL